MHCLTIYKYGAEVIVMKAFMDSNELIKFAEKFVEENVNRLETIVDHCLYEIPEAGKKGVYATFPAILYCFSTIELLGALCAGKAIKTVQPSTVQQSKNYMKDYMKYNNYTCELLMQIFRHKLTHIAEPKPIIDYNGDLITWEYKHEPGNHLDIEDLSPPVKKKVTSKIELEIDHIFRISISDFVKDIRTSTLHYLKDLKVNKNNLQNKFDDARYQIFSTAI